MTLHVSTNAAAAEEILRLFGHTLRSMRSMGRSTSLLLSLLNSTAPQPKATITNSDRNRFSAAPKREFHLTSNTAVLIRQLAHC